MQSEQLTALERSLGLLGPLEARIMREAWTEGVPDSFTVHDMQARMPELAYTTVMTTLHRLAEKGLLTVKHLPGRRAHAYRTVSGPDGFLLDATRHQVEAVVERFGEAAVAVFAERLHLSTDAQCARLREVAER